MLYSMNVSVYLNVYISFAFAMNTTNTYICEIIWSCFIFSNEAFDFVSMQLFKSKLWTSLPGKSRRKIKMKDYFSNSTQV